MMRMLRRVRGMKSERGAALVEFALVVPFLMLIMCATIDFGLAVYTLNNLTAAVREGGRFAAVKENLQSNDTDVRDRVYNYIVGMNNGLTEAEVKSKITNTYDPGTTLITVRITAYPYRPMTPLASILGLSTISLNRTAIFKYERAG